jgi:HAE1 family hydrophobic/amphiphilic exporter-1
MIYGNVETPPGTTLEQTDKVLNTIMADLLPVENIESVSTLGGYSLLTDSDGASYGMVMVNLKD